MIHAFALFLLLAPAAAQVRFHPVQKETVLERLASAPLKNEEREQALVKMFADAGCQAELQLVPRSKLANVICTLPGGSRDTIIVGGHLDKVRRGKGIVDDWSGASMLPTLYESLKTRPRRYTFVFIAFADEEKGLVGSRHYVQEMSRDARLHAKEMVNLECLGMNTTEVWASHSDPKLLHELVAVSKAMNIDVKAVNVESAGTADSESFAKAKIPRTTIHSVDPKTLAVLHSDQDNMNAIHPDLYYDSYQLIAGYLASLDDKLDRPVKTQIATQPKPTKGNTGTN